MVLMVLAKNKGSVGLERRGCGAIAIASARRRASLSSAARFPARSSLIPSLSRTREGALAVSLKAFAAEERERDFQTRDGEEEEEDCYGDRAAARTSTKGDGREDLLAPDEVSEILRSQLLKRRAAEQRAKKLQALVDSLTDENAKLSMAFDEASNEIASKNMAVEGFASSLEKATLERDEALVEKEKLEEKFTTMYLKVRGEVEAQQRALSQKEWKEERKHLRDQLKEAAAQLANLQADLSRTRTESQKETMKLLDSNTESIRTELSLECESAKASSQLASQAASESANAVIRVMSEQRKVKVAAADVRIQAKAAAKVVHDMKKQIESLQKENSTLQDEVKGKEEELYQSTMQRNQAQEHAEERCAQAEREAQRTIKMMEESLEKMRLGMEERVEASQQVARDSQGRVEGLLAELALLRDQTSAQTNREAEIGAKWKTLEANLVREKEMVQEEIEIRVSAFTDEIDLIQKATRAEATQKGFEQQQEMIKAVEQRHKKELERLEKRGLLSRAALEAAVADRSYWEHRAKNAELAMQEAEKARSGASHKNEEEVGKESDENMPKGRVRLGLRLPGTELRRFLAKGSRSKQTGGETSQVINSGWKYEA
jgi:hypothetical protein